jgi:hypothetical protein
MDGSSIGDSSVILTSAPADKHCAAVQSGKLTLNSCIQSNKYVCKKGKTACSSNSQGIKCTKNTEAIHGKVAELTLVLNFECIIQYRYSMQNYILNV